MSKVKKGNGHTTKESRSKYKDDVLAVNATFEEMIKLAVNTPPLKAHKKEKMDLK